MPEKPQNQETTSGLYSYYLTDQQLQAKLSEWSDRPKRQLKKGQRRSERRRRDRSETFGDWRRDDV